MLPSKAMFKASILGETNLLSPYSWRTHTSITCLSVLFHWTFWYPDLSLYFLMLQFSYTTIAFSIQNSSSTVRLLEDFRKADSWPFKIISDCSLSHKFDHLHNFILVSLEMFAMISSKESMPLYDAGIHSICGINLPYSGKKYLLLAMDQKRENKTGWVTEELCRTLYRCQFVTSLFIQIPF